MADCAAHSSAAMLRPSTRRSTMIRGIKFVSMPVRDQDAALKFFTEKLGFKVTTDQPMTKTQRWIELIIPGADSGLALFTPEGLENGIGEFQSLSFWGDDLFTTAKGLKAKGVQFEERPKKKQRGTTAAFS